MDCVGKSLAETEDKVAWRLKTISGRAGLDAVKVLTTYRAKLREAAPKPSPPPAPSKSAVEVAVKKGLDYGLAVVGTPYEWDETGAVGAGAPFWAANAPPPAPSAVRGSSCLCAGLTNLIMRAAGNIGGVARLAEIEAEELGEVAEASGPDEARARDIPRSGQWWGGTLAYWPYYEKVAEPFDIAKRYPAGTLIMRRSRWIPGGAWTPDQGHVAVILGNGNVLQSYAPVGSTRPGVTASVRLVDSHQG